MSKHIADLQITKASGDTEPFNLQKLQQSLHRAGASEEKTAIISNQIMAWIYPGVSTRQIYSRAFSLLKAQDPVSHSRYNLKNAFLELGPSGYPFEKIIGELFKRQGFSCETGITLQGCCITHEMDVIATKGSSQFLMECKYKHEQGKHISIQTPLYVHARVNDIVEQKRKLEEYKGFNFQPWVVTNTRFSKDSEAYGNCKGIKLLGWDYPNDEGLKDLVEKNRLYPVSILTNLTHNNLQKCLREGIVTCKQLVANREFINSLDISTREKKKLFGELEGLLK